MTPLAPVDNETKERRRRMMRAYLDGCTCVDFLAIRFGVTYQVAWNDLVAVREELLATDKEECKLIREKTVATLDRQYADVHNEWERSKQSREKITVVYIPKPCPTCKGSGWRDERKEPGNQCPTCNGDGELVAEETTRSVEGQTGDPRLAALLEKIVMDRAKLYGLPEPKKKVIQNNVVNLNVAQQQLNASPELLLKARSVIEELKLAGRNGKVIEQEKRDE